MTLHTEVQCVCADTRGRSAPADMCWVCWCSAERQHGAGGAAHTNEEEDGGRGDRESFFTGTGPGYYP